MPKTSTCRTFFISTFVITGIIIPAYSASLVSLITVFKPLAPISDMREFFENGKTRMLVKYGSYDYELFSVSLEKRLKVYKIKFDRLSRPMIRT